MRTANKYVAITGAAGFIGSHLVDRYCGAGSSVLGIDNLITGDERNLARAAASDRFTFVRADVSAGREVITEVCRRVDFHPDLILHFASPASPVDYADRPLETMDVNSKGTEACLVAAERYGARFLFASTSESYGDPLRHPQREDYWGNVNPVGPRSCYDESKRFGEALVMAWVRTRDADACIVRVFNTYGPRMRLDDGRVVPNFVNQALCGQALTVYGDGSQTRSFCYVDDLVEGIVRTAASERTRGQVVNLGNPTERTILEFARAVAEVVGVPLRVESRPLPPDDPTRRRPDIGRAQAWLGWEPRIELQDGLRRTVAAYRGQVTTTGEAELSRRSGRDRERARISTDAR